MKKQYKPPQTQKNQPGDESKMHPKPEAKRPFKLFRLEGKIAVITGGDSGIGRAVAIAFAQEGAHVAILYLNEHQDAKETQELVQKENQTCLLIPCDVRKEKEVIKAVKEIEKNFGKIDIVVNNAAVQFPQESILDITEKQLENTFRTNIFSFFYLIKAALPFMGKKFIYHQFHFSHGL